jgi:hypothetical protein
MGKEEEFTNLQSLMEKIDEAAKANEQLSWEKILQVLGHASFGPLLVPAGLAILAPVIGDIPGVPTLIGIFVMLIAGQLIIGRDHIWQPKWLLRQSIDGAKLEKSIKRLKPIAIFIDRLLRRRLEIFIHGTGQKVIAAIVILITLMIPLMEVVPFSANAAGLALTTFGLALLAHDGFFGLLAMLFTGGTIALVASSLL